MANQQPIQFNAAVAIRPVIDVRNNEANARTQLLNLYRQWGHSVHDRVNMPEKFDDAIVYFSSDPAQGINAALDEYQLEGPFEQIPGHEHHCCCSQDIQKRFYAVNRINRNCLMIGSVCIDKFDGEDDVYEEDGFVMPDEGPHDDEDYEDDDEDDDDDDADADDDEDDADDDDDDENDADDDDDENDADAVDANTDADVDMRANLKRSHGIDDDVIHHGKRYRINARTN